MLTRSSSVNSVIATHSRMISAPLSLMTSCGVDHVAERLRHLAAFEVDQEAVRQHLAERRPSARRQRRPAASSGTSRDAGRCPRGTCRPASPSRRRAPAPPRGSSRSRTRRRGCRARARTSVPPHDGHVSPSGRNSSIGRSYQASALCCSNTAAALSMSAGRQQRLAARRAVDGRDRHTPGALPRDAPVRPVGHHVEDPVAAPGRNPRHLVVDRVLRRVAERARPAVGARDRRLAVQPDEPLRGGEEDHGVVAAPAVRVLSARTSRGATAVRARCSAASTFGLASKTRWPPNSSTGVEEMAARVHRRVDVETVLRPGQEVVRAVAGRGMDRTGALLERDVVARARRLSRGRRAGGGTEALQ